MIRWLLSLFNCKPTFGCLPPKTRRSSGWPPVEKEVLAEHQECLACKAPSEVGHHIIPFHVAPERELDKSNIAALCHECHYYMAHFKGRWASWNPNIVEDAAVFRGELERRP